jgi:Family of unknown function (DUF5330)
MRLIRTSVILGGLLLVLPNPPADKNGPPEATPSNWALMSAASSAFNDVKTFCTRQANVCETADYLIARVEVKAKYGLKLVYEWANAAQDKVESAFAPGLLHVSQPTYAELAEPADEIMTGSTRSLRGTVQ